MGEERGDTMRWISFSVLLVVTVGVARLLQHQVQTGEGGNPQLQLTDTDRQTLADLSLPVVRREAESKKRTENKLGKKAKGKKLKQSKRRGRNASKKKGNDNKKRATKKKRNKTKGDFKKKKGRKQKKDRKGAMKKKRGDKAKRRKETMKRKGTRGRKTN